MSAPDPRITLGTVPAAQALLDEPNMLIQSLTLTAARTKTVFKGVNRCVAGVEYVDPILTFAFEGYISTRAALCDQHPGTQVTDLANFEATRFGFDYTVGTMVYEDPSSTLNLDNPESVKFNIVHYPLLTA